MRRIATVLAAVVALCLLGIPDVFAGGGFGQAPPGRTVGPAVKVSIVMEGPHLPPGPPPPSLESTPRQFAIALITPFGNADLATIVAIHDISCTVVGDQEFLAFTARVKFARF